MVGWLYRDISTRKEVLHSRKQKPTPSTFFSMANNFAMEPAAFLINVRKMMFKSKGMGENSIPDSPTAEFGAYSLSARAIVRHEHLSLTFMRSIFSERVDMKLVVATCRARSPRKEEARPSSYFVPE